jgi:glycosyltransferase involved in cell wall biosynthesis
MQDFTDFEHVFIDGQSKDKTITLLEKYKKHAKYPVGIYSKPAKGISSAFNEGIKEASGEYIFFLNSDDYFYDKNVLKETAHFLENNSFDWIYGKINVLEESGKSIGKFPERKIFQTANPSLLKFINFVPHQAVFMKKEVFEKFGGFDENLKANMDYDYYLRVVGKTLWRYFDRVISNYLIHKDSRSSSLINRRRNLKILRIVQTRYMNRYELMIAKSINFLIDKYNTTYRQNNTSKI